MLARFRKAMDEKEQGFTLIELLVVMIIIGILAAIAIPLFLNQKKKAHETAAKSDATNISKEVAAFLVDGSMATIAVNGGIPAGGVLGPAAVQIDASATAGTVSDSTTVKLGSGDDLTALLYNNANGHYCVEVTPHVEGASSAWHATQDGLTKGVCPGTGY